MRRASSIGLVLAALVLAVYWPVRHYYFLCYDDPEYVTDKPDVKAGLTWPSIRYALTTGVVGNWHPVTTLSHILDCQVFGVNPGPMHLVNAAFHAVNALLLFLVLRRMTGAMWRSAIVAAFFALHPLRIESVAWISERKDVLSGCFFLLTIWAYARYARGGRHMEERRMQKVDSRIPHPASRSTFHVSPFYLLALVFFILGLMSKPMLVTLPFVLLLLDYWPLSRIEVRSPESKVQSQEAEVSSLKSKVQSQRSVVSGPVSRITFHSSRFTLLTLLLEKLPFFALAAIFSVLTLFVQSHAGTTALNARFTLEDRAANALVSYVRYLGKLFWPTDLAAIYPHPASRYYLRDQWPGWETCAAGLLLLAVSALCLCQARRRPYLTVGWFWYLGMMVPVIGLIQAGEQSMADRYTYLPLIGPVLSLVWLLSELASSRTEKVGSQARHRLEVPRSSGVPGGNVAVQKRQRTGALPAHADKRAISGKDSIPFVQWALAALAVILLAVCSVLTRHQLHYWRDSVSLFEHTVEVTADNPGAQFALGIGLEKQGQVRRAMVHYRVAIDILPSYTEAHFNIGHLLREEGEWQRAAEEFRTTLRYKPHDLKFRLNLAGVMLEGGQTREAVQRFEESLQVDPDSTEALNNLAWILAANCDPAVRQGARAVEYAERACQLTQFKQTTIVGTLAAAYAEAGRFEDAVATAGKACALAAQHGEQGLLAKNQELLELYRASKPYHEPAAPPARLQ
jgi:Flp pilus assembly protein TadD